MDWTHENHQDAQVLERIDRSPLDVNLAGGDEQIAALIKKHNSELLQLDWRLRELADERTAMAGASDWYICCSAALRCEYRRMVDESWDALVALRKTLGHRQAVLRELESHVAARLAALADKRDAEFARIERVVMREHHVGIDTIVWINHEIAELAMADRHLRTLRHKARADEKALTLRQREVIPHVVA